MSSNRHLVVAYNFPPFVDASAITQAKRIAVAGHRVDVVSQDLTGLRPRDDALRALISHLIDVHDIIPGRPAFMSWPSMRHFAAGGLRRLAVRGTLARYATVYSRSMWPHSHVLAALVKAVHPGVHWSAEFSDPLLHNVDGSRRRSPRLPEDDAILLRLTRSLPVGYQELVRNGGQVLDLIQALTFGLADRLVFTNPQQRTVMLGDVGDDALAHDAQNRSLVSAHPVPPAHWVPPHSPHIGKRFGQVRIGFFGTLYANRGLGSITEAIRLLPESVRSCLRIDIFSAQREMGHQQVTRCGVNDVVRLHDELPYLTFLQRASGYDHLLVTDTRTGGFQVANPFLPSKISDYEATGVNILAITVPGSELSFMGYRPSARVDDVTSIKEALMQAVEGDRLAPPSGSDDA